MYRRLIVLSILVLSLVLTSCSDNSSSSTEGTVTPTISSKDISLEGPFILSVSSIYNAQVIEGEVIPLQEVVISTMELENKKIKVKVKTRNSTAIVTPTTVSLEDQTITFIAPISVASGDIELLDNGKVVAQGSYKVHNKAGIYLSSIEPSTRKAGERVVIKGEGLERADSVHSDNSDLNLSITLSNDEVSFVLPADARSGYFYLQGDGVDSNTLYLSIKRDVKVSVTPIPDSNISSSAIAFVLDAKEYFLDSTFETTIPAENSAQYIDATAELEDGSFAHLYSAVILPDMNTTVEVDAKSTAIALLSMGLGFTSLPQSEWRTMYDKIANNTETEALAQYIASLQKERFEVWNQWSDVLLKEKYQAALRSVLDGLKSQKSAKRANTNSNVVTITQIPESLNVYVNDINYGYLYNTHLNNGQVTVVNDTRLYLSVEVVPEDAADCAVAMDNDEGCVLNHYRHIRSPFEIEYRSVVKPKTGLLGISAAKTFELDGKDAHMQIITGGMVGNSDKENIASILKFYSFIDGVIVPTLDTVLSPLLGSVIPEKGRVKNVIDGLSIIYGKNTLVALTKVLANDSATWSKSVSKVLYKPIQDGVTSCLSITPAPICSTTLHGIAKMYGINSKNIYEELQKKMIEAVYDHAIKRTIVALPMAGWALEAAIILYESYETVTTIKTISGTISDITNVEKELNADVDFKLRIDEVSPMCIGVSPGDTEASVYMKGKGFIAVEGMKPSVYMLNEGDLRRNSTALDVPSDEKIYATFDAQALIDNRSVLETVFVDQGDYFIAYDKYIRVVDEGDAIVYFDAIEPDITVARATIKLMGCGWLPLNDIKVYFQTENGELQGEVVTKTVDTIEVKVPDTAMDGSVYVTTGNKRSKNLYLEVEQFGLTGTDDNAIEEHQEVLLEGKGLETVKNVIFTDSTGMEQNVTVDSVLPSSSSVLVVAPNTLIIGPVKVYAVREDGLESNVLTIKRVPDMVVADPGDSSFRSTLKISLSQADRAPIFYRINGGEEQAYFESFEINSSQIYLGDINLDVYARVIIDGEHYMSKVRSYRYIIDSSNKLNCPMQYDASLDIHPENPLWLVIGVTRDDEGYYVKYTSCDYYESGVLKNDRSYVEYNLLEGVYTTYYESGQVNYLKDRYTAGVLNGTITQFNNDDDHTVLYIGPFIDGHLDGLQQYFYETGVRKSETMYSKGAKSGLAKTYYENGGLESLRTYYDDYKLDGLYQTYYESSAFGVTGQLKSSGTYVLNKKHGEFKYYSSDGRMTSCKIYSDGTYVGSCMPVPD